MIQGLGLKERCNPTPALKRSFSGLHRKHLKVCAADKAETRTGR